MVVSRGLGEERADRDEEWLIFYSKAKGLYITMEYYEIFKRARIQILNVFTITNEKIFKRIDM